MPSPPEEPSPSPARVERRPRVAFQGAAGAFSEVAVRQGFPDGADAIPHATFADVIASVLAGRADHAVIPVENAIAGRVHVALEALAEAGDRIVHGTELRVPVQLSLLAPRGAMLAGIRRVSSHPMALAQCRIFFARHGWLVPEPHEDTAGAARDVAEAGDVTWAAVASEAAAERYDLEIVARHIQDIALNWTRFLVVSAR